FERGVAASDSAAGCNSRRIAGALYYFRATRMPSSSMPPPAAEVVPRLDVRDPDGWLRILSWVVIVTSALLILTFSFGRDQGIYALVGEGILRGKVPYRDLWDFKPPGIFFVYALAQGLFGKNMIAPRLLEVLALLGTIACMRRLTGVLFDNKTVGLVAGALTALIHVQMDFWHTGQPETFGALFTLLGLMLTAEPPRRGNVVIPLAVGVVFGCAALLKPPLGGGALVCAAYLAKRQRTRGETLGRALLAPLWVGIGMTFPVLLCLAWFAAKGALGDLYWTLGEFTPGYTTLSWEGRRASDMLYYAIEEAFFKFSALGTAGVIAAVAISPLFVREREGLFLVLGVIAIHVAGIAMQGKFFAYHYGATLPLIALFAGVGLYKLWRRCLMGGAGGAIAFFSFVAVAVPMRYAVRDLPQYFWERSWIRLHYLLRVPPYDLREAMDRELGYVADYDLAADRDVARRLRERTSPDETVFVWGFEPVIYWLSDRTPASRFIYNVPQRSPWEREYARSELMKDLSRGRPAALVVQQRDVFPSVTGRALDSKGELAEFPELTRMLDADFSYSDNVQDFELYLRRPK
ncbi:MAG TPA: glycosyltransferase family 39 protein, partial [Polyangiaceae bacterium]